MTVATDSRSTGRPGGPSPWTVFLVTAVGTFMGALDASIVNVALPAIAGQYGIDLSQVQWVGSGYLLAVSALLPLCGRLGDMRGRRAVFRLGFILFTVGSLLCGLSPTLLALILARLLQGLGAALLMAVAPALIMTAFPGPERGRALGAMATVVAVGTLVGPSAGGLIMGALGWQYLFYANLPIGLLGLALAARWLPPDPPPATERLDLPGTLLFSLGVTGLLLALSHLNDWGWRSPGILAGFATAAVCLPWFVRQERRTASPLVDLSLFSSATFTRASTASFLAYAGQYSNTILLPFYLHDQLRLPPSTMGLMIAVSPVVMAVVATWAGFLSERLPPSRLATIGMCITAAGLANQAALGPDSALWRPVLGQAILGFGFGLFNSPNNNIILGSAPAGKTGLVGGLQALVRNTGMIFGIALTTLVFETMSHAATTTPAGAFTVGFRAALLSGAALAAMSACLSLLPRVATQATVRTRARTEARTGRP